MTQSEESITREDFDKLVEYVNALTIQATATNEAMKGIMATLDGILERQRKTLDVLRPLPKLLEPIPQMQEWFQSTNEQLEPLEVIPGLLNDSLPRIIDAQEAQRSFLENIMKELKLLESGN